MNAWGNFIGYQITWFIAVIDAGHGRAWPGVLAAGSFIAWQLFMSPHRRVDTRLIAAALMLGTLIDGGLAATGLARYAANSLAVPPGAPFWILALWAAFALTLTHSLAWLQGRAWMGLALGAIGGPLAYLGAERGWQAVTFAPPVWRGLLWLSVGWGAALPGLLCIARWSRTQSAVLGPRQGGAG